MLHRKNILENLTASLLPLKERLHQEKEKEKEKRERQQRCIEEQEMSKLKY